MGALISQHNAKILKTETSEAKCNCRNANACPLPGKCTTEKVVYRATVTTQTSKETYVGLTGGSFKDRWYKHEGDFKHEDRRTSTELSSHIWELKDKNIPYAISWEIVKRSSTFSPITKKCNLCIDEKFEILYNNSKATFVTKICTLEKKS